MKRSFESAAAEERQQEADAAETELEESDAADSREQKPPEAARIVDTEPPEAAARAGTRPAAQRFQCRLTLASKQSYLTCLQEGGKWPLLIGVTEGQTKHHHAVLRRICRRMNPDYNSARAGVFDCCLAFASFKTLKTKLAEQKQCWLTALWDHESRGEEVEVWNSNLGRPDNLYCED